MRIAYLISAYTEPDSFQNLIRALQEPDADFYVHVDKKVDIKPFQDRVRLYRNVCFVPENRRCRVYWGGYSQVNMQLSMIDAMVNSGKKYDRVVNLTGTDYPVISLRKWHTMLEDEKKEYIIGFDVGTEVLKKKSRLSELHKNKYQYYHIMDTNRYFRYIIEHFLRIPRVKHYEQLGYNFCFGSEYWALSYECLLELVKRYRKDKKIQTILRTSYVPSEAWIHTMFFASEYACKGVLEKNKSYCGLSSLSPLSYFVYGSAIKVLDEKDYDKIVASEKAFARKIIKGPSDCLIHMIDQRRAENIPI